MGTTPRNSKVHIVKPCRAAPLFNNSIQIHTPIKQCFVCDNVCSKLYIMYLIFSIILKIIDILGMQPKYSTLKTLIL